MATLKSKSKAAMNENSTPLENAVETFENTEEISPVFLLPAGYVDADDITHREFELREMTGRDEEAIKKGDIRGNGSKVVNTLLERCVTRIGTLDKKTLGIDRWREVLKNLYAADQDYIIMKLRQVSVGDEVEMNHVCPQCKAKLKTFVSIDEFEVKPFDGVRSIPFTLLRGYTDKNDVKHTKGTMRQPTGFDREILSSLIKSNTAKATTMLFTRICSFDDGYPITADVMSDLTTKDREYLQNLLSEHSFGYNLSVDITCTDCGAEFKGTLDGTNFI